MLTMREVKILNQNTFEVSVGTIQDHSLLHFMSIDDKFSK